MLNPSSTLARFARLRRNSPAPISSTSDSATWVTISTFASGLRLATAAIPLPSLSEGLRSTRVARRAGAMPNSSAVPSESRSVNASTRASGATFSGKRSGPAETIARSASLAQDANITPSAPPSRASSRLSVSICRINRVRPAPSANRTAISLWRVVARASRRLAMLAQAMSRTSPTTAIRICKGSEN